MKTEKLPPMPNLENLSKEETEFLKGALSLRRQMTSDTKMVSGNTVELDGDGNPTGHVGEFMLIVRDIEIIELLMQLASKTASTKQIHKMD